MEMTIVYGILGYFLLMALVNLTFFRKQMNAIFKENKPAHDHSH